MTEKILSQEEIDALLHGVEGGEVNTTPAPLTRPGVAPYDFANPDRIIRGRMPLLDLVNGSFCRLFRTSLSSALRKTVDVSSKGVQMLKFGEFIKTLPVPSSLHVFKMDPLRGHAILVLESNLIFTLVDVFFGGSGKTSFRIEGRDFTAIESRLIQKVVTMVFSDLDKAWHSVHLLSFQYIRSEMNPAFVNIVPASDLVITISFGVELETFSGMITLCIPYSIIEPIKTKLYSAYQVDQMEIDHGWTERLLDRLQSAKVELKVELGRHHLMVQDLLKLKVGDVFLLEKEVSEPLVVRVEGIPKFLGKAGVCGGNKAIQIEEKLKTL
jgi:flagellar motor switch protein FliM